VARPPRRIVSGDDFLRRSVARECSAMSPTTGRRDTTAARAGAILLSGVCLAGCTGVTAANQLPRLAASGKATTGHAPAGGKAVVDEFAAQLRPRAVRSFEVKYAVGGSAPREIVYAVRPPGELVFRDTGLVSGKGRQIVVNGSVEYLCRSPGHARWTCQQLDRASAAAQAKTFGIYTAAYWAEFLRAFALTPGFARYHVSTFRTMRGSAHVVRALANPAGWHCLDFSPPGTHGIDVVCAVAPGILGLVTYHATSFMIESYDPSPPASLFVLPPEAKVIKPQAGAG
jgi:hypothetical protein